jgi:hypothetical protein
MLGPRIAERVKNAGLSLAGIALLAPNARPLEDLIYDQVHYLALFDGVLSPEESSSLKELKDAVSRVKALGPREGPDDPGSSALPLGLSAHYWLSLAGYDPVATAKALTLPILVIHGGRDYQVTAIEADLWKTGLASKKNASLRIFPSLGHLMLPASMKPSPADYERPRHVDEVVIRSIADFVNKQR